MFRSSPAIWVLAAIGSVACAGSDEAPPPPLPTDTETGEPVILPLDSFPIPEDTAPVVIPDLTPDNWVNLRQVGTWTLGSGSAPFGSVVGTLMVREFVDELDTSDTADDQYECDVEYSLTGTEVTNHDCSACDFVMAVEHYVVTGDPSSCHDPDAPQDGVVRNLGFDNGTGKIYFDYYGSGVWLPWYDADKTGAVVDYEWAAQLGIELVDSADM